MARLFIAIHLPEAVKADLTQKYAHIPTARWVNAPQLHFTLRFVGDISPAQFGRLDDGLSQVRGVPFEMHLNSVGCFPENPNRPTRVLWAGVSAPQALYDLQKSIDQAVIYRGFGAEEKPFRPHITLARLKTEKPLPHVQAFLNVHKQYRSEGFHVTRFTVIESQLSPQGATYVDIKTYPIQA